MAGDHTGTATCEVGAGGESATCDGLDYVLYSTLYDSPDAPRETLEIHIEEDPPPEHLEIRVTHDGDVILDRTFDPDYELAEPKCDADCRRARHDFAFDR